MAEGETAGNLGVRSFSGRTHSTRKEKTPVLSLTAGDRVRVDERDAADSSFCGCQTAGFGEKPATRRQMPSAGRESCFLASALEISAEFHSCNKPEILVQDGSQTFQAGK